MTARTVSRLLVLVLCGMATAAAAPLPETAWKLSKADADKWAARVRKLAPEGWTASVRGNDVILQRDKTVRFAHFEINGPPEVPGVERKPDLREGTFRLTLRFAPRMTTEEYERHAAVNAASEKERDRLFRAVDLPHKFDEFLAKTPEEEKRVQTYRDAVSKLTRYDLPDLYTPEYSLFLLVPIEKWTGYVYDKDAAAECQDVEETLLRYFGTYNPRVAAKGQMVGRPESSARR